MEEEQNEQEILENFVEKLVSNSTNLEGEIVDMINRNFKKLLLKID